MSTTEELLARLVNLENEAVQARQRQGSAEQALAAAQQRIQQLSSGGSAPTQSTGVIETRTLGKPKTFTGQPAERTTWQLTFKAFACATHARMRDVFELAIRKGSDPVIRSHFGSSHFLFERARCFSRSRAFLILSCPSVYNPVL